MIGVAMADEQTIRALGEQAYLFHLLVKALRERGQIAAGEPGQLWTQADFEEFLSDFRSRYFSEEP